MVKQTIQTNLLGTSVKMKAIEHNSINAYYSEGDEYAGKFGTIASIYLDRDGDPKYTIRLNEGNLIDVYAHQFLL